MNDQNKENIDNLIKTLKPRLDYLRFINPLFHQSAEFDSEKIKW